MLPLHTACLVFVIAIGPVLGFVPFLFQYYTTVADHYLYLAMLGPALALAWAVARWDRTAVRIACGALIVLLSILSIRQAGAWRNDRTLFAHTIRVNPDSFLAHNNLGTALLREADLFRHTPQAHGPLLAARDLFSRAIELRRKINRGTDDYFLGHLNLASALERLGEWELATWHRAEALKIIASLPPAARPDVSGVHHQMARNHMIMQRWPDALHHLDLVLQGDPANAAAVEDRRRVLEMMAK